MDSKNDLCVFSLVTRRMISSYAPPGHITAIASDPSLDYAFLGLQNGMRKTRITIFELKLMSDRVAP